MPEVIKSCRTCPIYSRGFFCDLPPQTLQAFDAVSSHWAYPEGKRLFMEGQQSHGIFVICSGRVKLSTSTAGGKSLIVRIAEAGEVLGLPGVFSGKPYEATAEALEPLQANYIRREPFLRFVRENGDGGMRVAAMLCRIYDETYAKVRHLGLYSSAAERLARLLLDRETIHSRDDGEERTTLSLTHEQIAESIGISRETVTRAFATFRRAKLIEGSGSTMSIIDKAGLQNLLGE